MPLPADRAPLARHGRSYRPLRPVSAVLAGLALLAASLLAPGSALASGRPAVPTGVAQTDATSTSITVGAHPSANATLYRLYVSTVFSDVTVHNIQTGKHTQARHYAGATSPSVTVGSLTYTTRVYYFRFVALNGAARSYSATVQSGSLRPSVPTNVTVSSAGGLHLTWSSVPTSGFTIVQASDPGMTADRYVYPILGPTHQFTPYRGLTLGDTYYLQVRGVTNHVASDYTAPLSGTAVRRLQGVRVMTYNVLETTADRKAEPGYPTHIVAPWAQRGPAAAALIHQADPAVVAVQEANDPIGPGRQIDTLATYLSRSGTHYAVANTGPENLAGGPYILYQPTQYRAVGAGGHWDLDGGSVPNVNQKRWAAYQELQNVSSGAQFLFVSAHPVAGSGAAVDRRRQAETQSLLAQTHTLLTRLHVPVVYGGDFNSDVSPTYTFDGPGATMRAAGVQDARIVAQTRANPAVDSTNHYARAPLRNTLDIDYVFTPPGIGVSSWGVLPPPSRGAIPSDHNPVFSYVYFGY